MRIALISEHASPLAAIGGVDAGGQNLHVAELATALARGGHDVRVYTRRDAPNLAELVIQKVEKLEAAVTEPSLVGAGSDPWCDGTSLSDLSDSYGVAHVPVGPARPIPKDDLLPYMGNFGAWLGRSWQDGDWAPDVVHAHFWMSGLAAMTATASYPCPVVLTYHALGTVKRRHQGAQDTSPPGRVGFERALGRCVDRVIAQCEDEVAELLRLGVSRRSISLVPSGVDGEAFSPVGSIAPRTGRARIFTVGRLVERKGFDTLISALPRVPEAELVIAGGPPKSSLDEDREARRLYHKAVKAGVSDRVRLLGRTPHHHMAEWYRSADVVACTPWYEPFGLTALEAMACGVPVVAAATGGLTDSVVDGVTGVHVPPRDPEATARALLALLKDPVRRICLSAAATDRVRARYTWKHTADRLQGIYEHVAERSNACGVMTS